MQSEQDVELLRQRFREEFLVVQKTTPSVGLPRLKSQTSLAESPFPTYSHIEAYFSNHFLRKTVHRTYWHYKDRYLLAWCLEQLLAKSDYHNLPVLMFFLQPAPKQATHFQELSSILTLDQAALRQRWQAIIQTKVQDFPWTATEDQIILTLKQQSMLTYKLLRKDLAWEEVAAEFHRLANQRDCKVVRNIKQIRERWNNQLNPNIKKGTWTNEESVKVCELVQKYGFKWRLISLMFYDRNESQVKNHYHSIMNHLKRSLVNFIKSYFQRVKYSESKLLQLVVSHHTANCLDLIKVIKLKKKNSSKKKIQKQNPEEGNKIATVGQTLCTKANMKPETKLEMEDLKQECTEKLFVKQEHQENLIPSENQNSDKLFAPQHSVASILSPRLLTMQLDNHYRFAQQSQFQQIQLLQQQQLLHSLETQKLIFLPTSSQQRYQIQSSHQTSV